MRSPMVVESDPVADRSSGVLDAVEALTMDALLLQRPDHTLHHAILLWAVRGDELLLEPVAADQGRELVAGEDQPVVGS